MSEPKKRTPAAKRPAAKKAAAPAKKVVRKTEGKKPGAQEPKKDRKRAKPQAPAPAVEHLQALQHAMGPKGKEQEPQQEEVGAAMARLNQRQRTFVREYLVDLNGTQAAIRAGYSEKTAGSIAEENLKKPEIAAAVREEQDARLKRLEIDGDDVVRRWHQVFYADANELSQHRRNCCRHCHGEGFEYQYTPGEYRAAKIRHEVKRVELMAKSNGKDIGEFPPPPAAWYDKRRDPHPNCPECFGEGEPEVWLADTRKLSPAARALYAGVKEGKDGIEVKAHDQQKAGDQMARHLGLYNDSLEIVDKPPSEAELDEKYAQRMAIARQRQAEVRQRRKGADS